MTDPEFTLEAVKQRLELVRDERQPLSLGGVECYVVPRFLLDMVFQSAGVPVI